MSGVREAVLSLIEIAEEQGYRTIDKGGGTWMVLAPAGRPVNPEYRTVTLHMPRSDGNNAVATIRQRLKRAGVRFDAPERTNGRRNCMQSTSKPMTGQVTSTQVPASVVTPAPPSKFYLARVEINSAISALSRLESILGELEVDSEKLQKLKELLKGLNQ